MCIYAHVLVDYTCEARRFSKFLNRNSKQGIASNVDNEVHEKFLPGRGLNSGSLN